MPGSSSVIWELVIAASIIVIFALLDGVAYLLLQRLARGLTRRFRNRLGDRLIGAVTGPVLIFVPLQGVFLATTTLRYLDPWGEQIGTAWGVTVTVLVVLIAARVATSFFSWYGQGAARRRGRRLERQLMPPLRRLLLLGIYILGAMLILDQLGISITPMVAGLGIGGLAVALALQPVLGNFFAGTYILSDGAIHVGDYIELESGVAGYVTELGWRSTKIRTPFNNLIVIPNSRLADSIVTNYQVPSSAMWALVTGGVSYESDLAHVEQVTLEVAREVLRECPGAVEDSEPWFGFDTFGDSNIGFWIFLQATDRLGTFAVKSELVKRIHKRFGQEGIEINYPVRKLVSSSTDGAPSPTQAPELKPASATPRRRSRRPSL